MRRISTICLVLAFIICIAPSTHAQTAADAARDVLQRLVPDRAAEFVLEVIPPEGGHDVFEIETAANGTPVIRGSSATAIMSGVNWYLKYYCLAHVSWTGDQLNLPRPLPPVPEKIRKVTPYKYRYIYNYCTFNYTMSFWDWPRWERELDFLALNGVNLVLTMTGQEKVWQNFMRQQGFSEQEISEFIVGPAFQAWWLMGNIEGWGGPVSQEWIDHQYELQKKILARMDELGMEPVLQGFYGMFPVAGIERFPESRIYETGKWAEFERPAMFDPTEPAFADTAAAWYDEQRKLYGNRKFYGGDPFHEGGSADIDLTDAGHAIQHALLAAHPDASWVIQAWQSNPKKEMMDGADKDHTLIIELFAEGNPQWKRREGFWGHPWVWAIISNFGGRPSLFGAMNKVAADPPEALASPGKGNLQGIGAIMEATEMDPPLWDLLFEMAWRTDPVDPDAWIQDYAARRYGKQTPEIAQAWQIVRRTAYNSTQKGERTPACYLCQRPALEFARVWGSLSREYDNCDLAEGWKIFVENADAYKGIDTFEHDIVDITRQVISNSGITYLQQAKQAWDDRDAAAFRAAADRFLVLIMDQDALMATDRMFLLGRWIQDARALGKTPKEKDQFEWNARVQITTWGPREPAGVLMDYSNREWADLLGTFYHERWKMFFDKLADMLENPDKYPSMRKKKTGADMWNSAMAEITGDNAAADPSGIDWYAWEEEWTHRTGGYRTEPEGDRISESAALFEKYYPEIQATCK